jgi:hypothetical protein
MIIKETADVWFAAFLMHQGWKLKSVSIKPDKKVSCSFETTEELWATQKVEFNNSEIVKIKSLIRQIKQMGD